MADQTLTDRVLDTLVEAGLLTTDQLGSVLEACADGTPVGAVLLERGLVTAADVGTALEDALGVPRVDLSSYAPDDEALALVPAETARATRLLPLFEIDGTLTVAIGDAMDVFSLDEVGAGLGVELDPVLADAASLLAAVVQYYGAQDAAKAAESPAKAQSTAAPKPGSATESSIEHTLERFVSAEPGSASPGIAVETEETAPAAPESATVDFDQEPEPFTTVTPSEAPEPDAEPAADVVVSETLEQMAAASAPAGTPAIDLDVLAVADAMKVALLVASILEDAAQKGATRIHLLPYKEDFFLVYRLKGRLEKISSAPLSLQGPLIDAFKSFARISGAPASMPALGRVRAHLAGRDLALMISVVPTIAGQRMVISFSPLRSEPRGLTSLGMNEAEIRALQAMVERGRGILLVAAPAAEGRSSTYYALLAHAAAVGKTVYSVERSIEYEIPAVAQVLVNPGSPIGASSYLAVGIRQDTDVLAIDGLQSIDDIQLAVEAAGAGRLVIATLAAGSIVEAVRRMLDIGAEPHGLASALTVAVGQRLVRMNCPQCAVPSASPLLAALTGLPKGTVNMSGAGCASCVKTGFQGVTGIFEVLPFTGPVRAAVATAASRAGIEEAVRSAGMRPLLASGAARVASGQVSAEELDRVLRFAGP